MKNEATLQFVQLHREDDVNRLAFLGDKNPDVDMPWALAQISGWQTARRKLPSWAACDGLEYPPHLNMEQCSSEPTAIYKASLASRLVGADAAEHGLLVDLTGGFGVDFSWMARAFAHAVYVERNETLCPIAQHNFQQLGLGHVEIHVGDGVAYLQTMPLVPERTTGCSHPLTLIYLDPARRDTYGRKVFGMEDCTPDVVELCDTLLLRADIVVIKLSPMLDWHEAVRKLKNISEVHVVSVSNECKELLLVLTRENALCACFVSMTGRRSLIVFPALHAPWKALYGLLTMLCVPPMMLYTLRKSFQAALLTPQESCQKRSSTTFHSLHIRPMPLRASCLYPIAAS